MIIMLRIVGTVFVGLAWFVNSAPTKVLPHLTTSIASSSADRCSVISSDVIECVSAPELQADWGRSCRLTVSPLAIGQSPLRK
jgi:hypothetical protein